MAHEAVGARMESVTTFRSKGPLGTQFVIGRTGKADMKGRTNPLETPIARFEINCSRNK